MIQQIRQDEPLYRCVVLIESVTGRSDEELMAFGVTEVEAKCQVEALLRDNYDCTQEQIAQLMQHAQVESLSPWCGTGSNLEGEEPPR
ncbi:MAG: hypothetical protein Kow00121_34410 [Elainellaceae cyanobacterium]